MSCNTPISCELINSLSVEEILRKVLKADVNGCLALNTVTVDGDAAEQFVTCENKDGISIHELIASLVTIDSEGNWAIRIIESTE